jgi:hypothetical protein
MRQQVSAVARYRPLRGRVPPTGADLFLGARPLGRTAHIRSPVRAAAACGSVLMIVELAGVLANRVTNPARPVGVVQSAVEANRFSSSTRRSKSAQLWPGWGGGMVLSTAGSYPVEAPPVPAHGMTGGAARLSRGYFAPHRS